MMVNNTRIVSVLLAASVLAACSTNGAGTNPPNSPVNLQQNSKLQFAVGTMNYAPDDAVGLNTVVTFRQRDGNSAVLVSTPTITGPAGFTVPAAGGASGTDGGTNHISGTPQGGSTATTFGTAGGAFSYGFAPDNSDQSGSPNFGLYPQPFYSTNQIPVVGGAPAYPFIYNGTYPPGFTGYSQGWNGFEAAPVAGSYALSVNVAVANGPSATFTASANLNNTAPLPTIAAPGFTPDGAGGGTINATVPADPRIVETMAYAVDLNAPRFYSVGPVTGTGALSFTLPPNLGPCAGNNCQSGSGASPTITPGDNYMVFVVSYDYPMFEASPPSNKSQTPTIVGSGGQADVSVSQLTQGTY